MKIHYPIWVLQLFTALFYQLAAQGVPPSQSESEFKVIAQKTEKGRPLYFFYTLEGIECRNNSLNRLSLLSENQLNYPNPESGCGPTAMLNLLVWYEKYGLIDPRYRDADSEKYKLKLFREIDHRLAIQAGTIRTNERGIRNLDIAVIMDSIVRERSKGAVRIHTDIFNAPIELKDILESMRNFRSGYFIVQPEDPNTGELLNDHATVVIRIDRAGYITLANWGQHYHGLLKMRNKEQWFIPQDPKHLKLKIIAMVRFIPFQPKSVS